MYIIIQYNIYVGYPPLSLWIRKLYTRVQNDKTVVSHSKYTATRIEFSRGYCPYFKGGSALGIRDFLIWGGLELRVIESELISTRASG